MRGKNLLWLSLISVLIGSTMVLGIGTASPLTKVSVEPSSLGNVTPGTVVTIDVTVENIVGLNAWEVKLSWNPLVVKPVDTNPVVEGPFLKTGGPTSFAVSIPLIKHYALFSSVIMTPTSASGSGTLASVTLIAVGAGSTDIRFKESMMLDVGLASIPHNTYDGHITVHSIAEVTGRWEEHQRYSFSEDEDEFNTMYAKVEHMKPEVGTVYVYVEFLGFAADGQMIVYESDTVPLDPEESVVLSADFEVTEWGYGSYSMDARSYVSYDIGGHYYPGDNIKELKFVILP